MNTALLISELIEYGINCHLIEKEDEYVVRNNLMDIMQINAWEDAECASPRKIDDILNDMVDDAAQRGVIQNTNASRDLFDTKIMGALTPMPREVNRVFREKYAQSPAAATDWYYDFSKQLNYVRAGRIAKDLKWVYKSEYGDLDVTINLSKPEKDPRDIAAARTSNEVKYPQCQLCSENAGFAGSLSHPARQNLRPVEMTLNGEQWQLQYSPYGYYNEHCVLFNRLHTPMVINRSAFMKLFDAITQLPHYFFGSNADLPIVGGSILTHEHFQGGRYVFAMEKATVEKKFVLAQFPNVSAGIVKWPMSVIRLRSDDKIELANACAHILDVWRGYSDESVGILSQTDGVPHNTITPIARMSGGKYECDLVLRNNRTTDERPLGIFHPNPSLHHIKKENIGLIEVMGLAVLPARLQKEMTLLKERLIAGEDVSKEPSLAAHTAWADEILKQHPEFSSDNADEIIKLELGRVFVQVLCDCGVFKRDNEGAAAFARFIDCISGQ